MDSFGAYLKLQREEKGIRLEEIASITKIHLHALELLESDQWDRLPPEPFIRGFIVAYAKYVGLDPNDTIERYKDATGLSKKEEESAQTASGGKEGGIAAPVTSSPNEIITQFRMPSAPKIITGASLLGVVGLAVLLINVGKQSEEQVGADSTPTQVTMIAEANPDAGEGEASKVAETAQEVDPRKVALTTDPAKKPAGPEAVAAPSPHEILINAKERTWVKVVIDEDPPQELFLDEGKSATYRAMKKIKVVLGNATGSTVVHNGEEAQGRSYMGTIKSYKFPADARFPQDVPAKKADPEEDGDDQATQTSSG